MKEKRKRGRPAIGITKKVSVTLTKEEWDLIRESGLTVSAFLRKRIAELNRWIQER